MPRAGWLSHPGWWQGSPGTAGRWPRGCPALCAAVTAPSVALEPPGCARPLGRAAREGQEGTGRCRRKGHSRGSHPCGHWEPKFRGEGRSWAEGFPLGQDPGIPAGQGTGWEGPGTGPVPGNRGWARALGTLRLLSELGRGWNSEFRNSRTPRGWEGTPGSGHPRVSPFSMESGVPRDARAPGEIPAGSRAFPPFQAGSRDPRSSPGAASASSSFTGSGIPRHGTAPTRVREGSGALPPFQAGSRDPRSSPGAAPRLGLLTTVN